MAKIITLIAIVVFFIILFLNLGQDKKTIPSPFINKPFPSLEVIDFQTNEKYQIRDNFSDWTLVNFWASWCVTCRVEHPMLIKIKNSGKVKMLGINYKDKKTDANNFLKEFDNPFTKIVFDNNGRVGIELGVYAMPESFLVDKNGVIKAKHLGEMTEEIWQDKFLSIINK